MRRGGTRIILHHTALGYSSVHRRSLNADCVAQLHLFSIINIEKFLAVHCPWLHHVATLNRCARHKQGQCALLVIMCCPLADDDLRLPLGPRIQ